ncbi:hypothetical protein EDD18DRAFT_1426644 [Armillaria luteobubalina]|uniref:Uncharacterized protein n=1 Tax=Armillaria luteobubalina TaxID=153913 RepID=A0AA39QI62_9AGAR|nr:hypothetical protein EDD18DRAFT_1426644 [Armillaria luteobubalina]
MVDEMHEEDEEELEEEMDDWGDREFVSDISGDENEDGLSDLEEAANEGSEGEGQDDDEDEDGSASKSRENVVPKNSHGKRKAPPPSSLKLTRNQPEKKTKKESTCGSRIRAGSEECSFLHGKFVTYESLHIFPSIISVIPAPLYHGDLATSQ